MLGAGTPQCSSANTVSESSGDAAAAVPLRRDGYRFYIVYRQVSKVP